MLAFCAAVDFEGDQWTFFKPPHADLERALRRRGRRSSTVYRPLAEHVASSSRSGRLVHRRGRRVLPARHRRRSYRLAHEKTSIAVEPIDIATRAAALLPQRRVLRARRATTSTRCCAGRRPRSRRAARLRRAREARPPARAADERELRAVARRTARAPRSGALPERTRSPRFARAARRPTCRRSTATSRPSTRTRSRRSASAARPGACAPTFLALARRRPSARGRARPRRSPTGSRKTLLLQARARRRARDGRSTPSATLAGMAAPGTRCALELQTAERGGPRRATRAVGIDGHDRLPARATAGRPARRRPAPPTRALGGSTGWLPRRRPRHGRRRAARAGLGSASPPRPRRTRTGGSAAGSPAPPDDAAEEVAGASTGWPRSPTCG